MYITYADAVKFLEEGIAERGADYINVMHRDADGLESCVYRVPTTGEPSCGVGLVLAKAGLDLSIINDRNNGHRFGRLYDVLNGKGELYMHPYTRQLLCEFQSLQDSQETWGFALESAKSIVPAPDPVNDVMSDAL